MNGIPPTPSTEDFIRRDLVLKQHAEQRIKQQREQWICGQLMKTILIETVTNGWIVRPFSACETWAQGEKSCIAVFTKMEELQKAIPMLMADDFKYTEIKYTQKGDESCSEVLGDVPGKGLWDGLKVHVDCREKK